jgi:3-keto-L-gulonate-6-phosphate decarboxylase
MIDNLDLDSKFLQVAIDVTELNDALNILEKITPELEHFPWLCEIGTPLIKNEGLKNVVSEVRKKVGDTPIVADMKTLDTGEKEVELVYNNNGDIITVSGASESSTILSALKKGYELEIGVMIDTIGINSNPKKLDEIAYEIKRYNENGGIGILEYHIPIDNKTGRRDFSKIGIIKSKYDIPLAAAGGLNETTIPEVLKYGTSICVVGRRIIRPENETPTEAVRKIKEVILEYNNQNTSLF